MSYVLDELIKIIICDDDGDDQKKILRNLEKFENKKNIKFGAIEIVTNCNELSVFLEKNKNESFILFQDVLLEDKNGINIVNENQNLFRNCEIIFITHSKNFRKKIYEVSHSYYLEKVEIDDFFDEALELTITKFIKRNKSLLVLRKSSKIYKFRMDDIIYIESKKRIVKIIGNNICSEIYYKIDDVEKLLDSRFIRCHKSYIANFDRIRAFEKNSFLMDDGTILAISRSKKKYVNETMVNLIHNSSVLTKY